MNKPLEPLKDKWIKKEKYGLIKNGEGYVPKEVFNDVSSAVEWLKEETEKYYGVSMGYTKFFELIDEAFSDVTKVELVVKKDEQ